MRSLLVIILLFPSISWAFFSKTYDCKADHVLNENNTKNFNVIGSIVVEIKTLGTKRMIINEEDGEVKDLLVEKENQKVYVSEVYITKIKKNSLSYTFDKTNDKLIVNVLSSKDKDIKYKEFHFKCNKL